MKIIDIQKKEQRNFFLKKRSEINKKEVKKKLFSHLSKLNYFQKSKIISSFISYRGEISTQMLNEQIVLEKKILCLPVIKENSKILFFRKYDSKKNLIKGKYGIMIPKKSKNIITPEIILVPCLAFDLNGYRLGYGGGYYDQTIYKMKNENKKFISIAVAFDFQKAKKVVHDDFDQKIDYILTEKKLYKSR